jgi:hypothetical protein
MTSERFLLAPAEIAELASDLAGSCEIIEATKQWHADTDVVHEGRLVVRKM